HKAEQLASHLEAGRRAEFLSLLADMACAVPDRDDRTSAQCFAEAYYAAALVLYSSINRLGLHGRIECVKLLRLDDHASIRAGFDYLKQVAEAVFRSKQSDERDRAAQAIARICQYV